MFSECTPTDRVKNGTLRTSHRNAPKAKVANLNDNSHNCFKNPQQY